MINNPFFDKKTVKILEESVVIFVSDMFVDEYVGGAELTSQALIDSCPLPIQCIKSSEISMDVLAQGTDKFCLLYTSPSPRD